MSTDSAGFGPWQTPTAVPELASPAFDATPTAPDDVLEIMFESNRSGTMQLWHATRSDPDAQWTNVEQVVLTTMMGAEPALSSDGLELLYHRDGGPLARTTRPTRASPWTTPVTVGELPGYHGVAFAGDNRLLLNFGPANTQLYETTRPDSLSPWDTPHQIVELASAVPRDYPTASRDGREIIFEDGAMTSQHLARAVRPTIDDPFGAPEPIQFGPPFDTGVIGDPELSADGTTLWFTSNTSGMYEIYVTRRARL